MALLLSLGSPSVAQAGGFPPVAAASADPMEALVGEPIAFSAVESFDPDDSPAPLTYAWDFGDGTTATIPTPTHAFDTLGLHIVSLTVSDGASQSLVNLEVVTLPPPTDSPPRASGPLSLSADGVRLAVANADSNSISIVDTASLSVLEFDACERPRNVAWARADTVVLLTCFESDELWALDPATGELLDAIPTGRQPLGVVEAPQTGLVLVANYGSNAVTVLAPDLSLVDEVPVAPGPWALATTADGSRAHVTHLLSGPDAGRVSVLDLDSSAVLHEILLVDDPGPDTSSSGRGTPTVLASIAIDPAGAVVWVGGIKANTNRGPTLDGQPLHPRNRLRGVLAPFGIDQTQEMLESRLDTNDADSVSAVAFSPRGRYAYVTHQGAARLSVYDVVTAAFVDTSDGTAVDEESRVDTGDAPDGVAVSPDGSRVYVNNALSRDVTVFDVSDPGSPLEVARVAVTAEPLPETIALGKRLFFSSREPLLSDQNYIACASCHPDGGSDGRVWDFTQYGEGRRNTIDLRGRAGTGHGPVHWTANFDEIQDFENDIQGGFGGEGFLFPEAPHPPLDPQPNAGRSTELDALAAYVSSLDTFPQSPHRQPDGDLSPAAQRGYELFFDEAVGCAGCHVPPNFTDSALTDDPADYVRHLVGTERASSGQGSGGPLQGFDTPTVLGLWASPPYLHDGRAPTLHDVLTTENPDDLHGVTSHLDAGDIDDLVVFLLSLQGEPDEHPELPSGETSGGSSSSGADPSSGGVEGSTTTDAPETSTGAAAGDGSSSATEPASASPDPSGCACQSTRSPGTPWAALLFAIAFVRRRNPSSRP